MLGLDHAAICTSDFGLSLRFWRTGDWPELFGAKSNQLGSIFLGDPQIPDCEIVELVELSGAGEALVTNPAIRHGFFLLSLQRDGATTLSTLAGLGFTDGLRQITVPTPAGKSVPMAVITAPDGVLVELIGGAT